MREPYADNKKNIINLRGSVSIVSEFFFIAVNSILYQRGIYQPETFTRESRYGLTVLITTDKGLLSYLMKVMDQIEIWLLDGKVNRLVVVVSGINSGDTLERWQFNAFVEDRNIPDSNKTISSCHSDNSCNQNCLESQKFSFKKIHRREKSLKETHNEIQAIIRQITASVTFLPLLNEPCSFDLLVYTDKKADIPRKWEDSDPRYIMNSQNVKLRSFTTSVHKIDSMVTYKEVDEWEL